MDNARLQLFMHILMHEDLLAKYNAKNTSTEGGQSGSLDNIVALDDWCTAVGHIDRGWRTRKDREHKLYLKQLKSLDNLSSNISVPSGGTASNSRFQSLTPLQLQKQAQSYALPLTINKRNLLAANKGCTTCQKVFLPNDHKCAYKDKPLLFRLVPTITQAHVDKICSDLNSQWERKVATDSNVVSVSTVSPNIAAVLGDTSGDSKDDRSDTFELMDKDTDMDPEEYILPKPLYCSDF
ncbi:hypothetical protein C0991_000594 [Blastosporella zonata]|nr:hypothetical protein C0991_000594 [Blastosporella zonata]